LRELEEEAGFQASELVKLAEFYLAPGYSTELMHLFE
jgi:ADP-ribose pyrophosphatase